MKSYLVLGMHFVQYTSIYGEPNMGTLLYNSYKALTYMYSTVLLRYPEAKTNI